MWVEPTNEELQLLPICIQTLKIPLKDGEDALNGMVLCGTLR